MTKQIRQLIFKSLLLICICCVQITKANKTDSLRNLIKHSKEDTNKVKWYNDLYRSLSLSGEDNQELKISLDKALELAKKLDFKKGIIYSYSNLGLYFKNIGNKTFVH